MAIRVFKIARRLWNTELYCRVHKIQSLTPTLGRMSQVNNTLPPHFFILLFSDLTVCLPINLFRSGVSTSMFAFGMKKKRNVRKERKEKWHE
jgi:hypothetical protein